jgi:hypothetical protein
MTFPTKVLFRTLFPALFVMLFLFSCQPNDNPDTGTSAEVKEELIDSLQQERRNAPEFYIIPPDMVKNRVWICDNEVSDIFHVKNDCPVFLACRTTKRNVTLARAIEEYECYNCMTCSEELNHIFDENMLRLNN